jgi:hypothetical protein
MLSSRTLFAAMSIVICGLVAAAAEPDWQQVNLKDCETTGNWMPQPDGSLYLEPREGEEGWKRYSSYLWLRGEYTDFECRFEYKHDAGGNSGFYFRVPDTSQPVAVGIELQIKDSTDVDKAGFHDLGGIIKFEDRAKGAPLTNAAKPAGQWNTVEVRLKDNLLTVVINDKKVHDRLDLAADPISGGLQPSGRLGIQDHGVPFWVRNIRVRRL